MQHNIIARYLSIMKEQDEAIQHLKAENQKLKNQRRNALAMKESYKLGSQDWRDKYLQLQDEHLDLKHTLDGITSKGKFHTIRELLLNTYKG